MTRNRCYLTHPLRDAPVQCCCNCTHHKVAYSHPHTDGQPIHERRGYVCEWPEALGAGGVFTDWPQHSIGCELHDPKKVADSAGTRTASP